MDQRLLGVGRVGTLEAAGDLSPQDISNNIFIPAISYEEVVDLIGIFRPEGEDPTVTAGLVSRFSNTTIKWVSLADFSYGAAVVMHRESTSSTRSTGRFTLPLPLGITLANGQTVTAMEQGCSIPGDEVVLFTNSCENQTTATIRFVRGTLPGGVVIIRGLSEKPKGDARIQVTIDASRWENTIVTVEEVGSTARKVVSIPRIATCTCAERRGI